MIEGAIEGSLAQATAGRLHPVEIAKKVARALDAGQTVAAGKILVPNAYTVLLSSQDFASVSTFRQSLERELLAYVRSLAAERQATFVASPRLSVEEDAALRPRRTRVVATLSDAPVRLEQENMPVQATAQAPVLEVRAAMLRSAQLTLADGRTLPLDRAVVSLGRALDNDVVLEEGRVSRRHAQIRFMHNSFCLYDLASANGTQVNGQAVDQVILRDGDTISLGGFDMTFHQKAAGAKRGA